MTINFISDERIYNAILEASQKEGISLKEYLDKHIRLIPLQNLNQQEKLELLSSNIEPSKNVKYNISAESGINNDFMKEGEGGDQQILNGKFCTDNLKETIKTKLRPEMEEYIEKLKEYKEHITSDSNALIICPAYFPNLKNKISILKASNPEDEIIGTYDELLKAGDILRERDQIRLKDMYDKGNNSVFFDRSYKMYFPEFNIKPINDI